MSWRDQISQQEAIQDTWSVSKPAFEKHLTGVYTNHYYHCKFINITVLHFFMSLVIPHLLLVLPNSTQPRTCWLFDSFSCHYSLLSGVFVNLYCILWSGLAYPSLMLLSCICVVQPILHCWVMFHCMDIPQLFNLFTFGCTSEYIPNISCYKYSQWMNVLIQVIHMLPSG